MEFSLLFSLVLFFSQDIDMVPICICSYVVCTHTQREKEPRFNPNFNVPINLVRDPGVYSSTTSYFLPPTQSKAFLLSMAFLVLPHFALTFE